MEPSKASENKNVKAKKSYKQTSVSPSRDDDVFVKPSTPKSNMGTPVCKPFSIIVEDCLAKSLSVKKPMIAKFSKTPAQKSPLKKLEKKSHTLSESSSSSDEESDDEQTKFMKLLEMKEVPENVTAPIGVKAQSNIKLLKESFKDKNLSFDDAMKVYTQKKKQIIPPAKVVPPLIIPAPETDPTMKRGKKRKLTPKEETRPDAHLGGIFTINNGWDKPIPKKEPPKMIPREQRFLPPITLINPGLLHNPNDYLEELAGIANTPELPDNDEDFKRPKFHRSIFDSDDDDDDDDQCEKKNVTPANNDKLEEKSPDDDDKLDAKSPANHEDDAKGIELDGEDYKHSGDSGCDESELMLWNDE